MKPDASQWYRQLNASEAKEAQQKKAEKAIQDIKRLLGRDTDGNSTGTQSEARTDTTT